MWIWDVTFLDYECLLNANCCNQLFPVAGFSKVSRVFFPRRCEWQTPAQLAGDGCWLPVIESRDPVLRVSALRCRCHWVSNALSISFLKVFAMQLVHYLSYLRERKNEKWPKREKYDKIFHLETRICAAFIINQTIYKTLDSSRIEHSTPLYFKVCADGNNL